MAPMHTTNQTHLSKPPPPQLNSAAISMHVNLDLLRWNLPHHPICPLLPQLRKNGALLPLQPPRPTPRVARHVYHPRAALRRPRAAIGQHHRVGRVGSKAVAVPTLPALARGAGSLLALALHAATAHEKQHDGYGDGHCGCDPQDNADDRPHWYTGVFDDFGGRICVVAGCGCGGGHGGGCNKGEQLIGGGPVCGDGQDDEQSVQQGGFETDKVDDGQQQQSFRTFTMQLTAYRRFVDAFLHSQQSINTHNMSNA